MKRGELYRVTQSSHDDPKKHRVFVIVSRQALINSRFSTVICAPIYSSFENKPDRSSKTCQVLSHFHRVRRAHAHDNSYEGLSTQVSVGIEEGLKHDSSIHCDALMSLPKSLLTHFIGTLSPEKIDTLNKALAMALDLPEQIFVL